MCLLRAAKNEINELFAMMRIAFSVGYRVGMDTYRARNEILDIPKTVAADFILNKH